MSFNFNDAEPQKTGFGELIPNGTIALVVMSLRPGGHGDGGWLKNSKSGESLMLDCEFTIEGGDYDRRKFWGNYVTEGQTEGQQKAAPISRSLLRAVLESAHGVDPGDTSDSAMEKRQVNGWGDFDGLRFCAKIGIEKGGLKDKMAGVDSERYSDKNVLREAVTSDNDLYLSPGKQSVATGVAANGNTAQKAAPKTAAKASGAKPSWAS